MRILVVSDGRRGIENQALGLAEAVALNAEQLCEITSHRISHGATFAALPPSLQLTFKRDFGLTDADLVIGCGRQAIAPLIDLRKRTPAPFTVYVQDPKLNPTRFDLVIAPDHDGLSGPNVETMIGSPNRVTRDRIITGTLAEANRLSKLPMPRAMIAIGGPSRTHAMGTDRISDHIQAAIDLSEQGYSLLVTTSRRTPEAAQNAWQDFAQTHDRVWLHTPDSPGENPYFAFLGGASVILVTEDSTNMLTEGCATGKPVYRLPMDGAPGKFQILYDALAASYGAKLWDGAYDDADSRSPLDETTRMARRVLTRYIEAQQQ